MLPDTYAAPLYHELEKIAAHPGWSTQEKVTMLAVLLEKLFFEATKQEQIAFSSLFARISYAGHRFDFQQDVIKRVHRFRLAAKWVRRGQAAKAQQVQLGIMALSQSVETLTQMPVPASVKALWLEDDAHEPDEGESGWLRAARVIAIADRPEDNCLLVHDEQHQGETVWVRYGLPDRNENFTPSIQVIRKVFGFPVTLNLLDVNVDAQGVYHPRAFVIEPDYLMDVSAVSECFRDTGPDPYAFLLRKFTPFESTEPQLIGNIANYFLDRLLNDPNAAWKDTFRECFQLNPFAFAPMSDAQVKDVAGKAQKHFLNLKNMAAPKGGLEKEGIQREDCFLEPAFYAEQYGLQGRLDLLYRTEEKAAIVELKSGTPFKPNSYGIARSHFTQTLLYDLLVRSVFGQHSDPIKFILYSGADLNQLRFAPTIASEQWEALQVRNQLVAIERLLTKIVPGDLNVPVFSKLRATGNAPSFVERDFARFEAAYTRLDTTGKKYFNAFTGFIAREHWLARIGEEGSDQSYGHAGLWRTSYQDKSLNFSILSHLEIAENRASEAEPVIVFKKSEHTHPLANFRVGDIAVLYPATDETDNVLHHQVIKCTITELTPHRVVVHLRFRQHNLRPFDTQGYWCLEPDLMDSGFAAMYRGLLEWAEGGPNLATSPNALAGSDSEPYLIWGPPGTGKTSVLLRNMTEQILRDSADNLLLMAYTNRAVDEICEALDSIGGDIRAQYVRIGSKFACAERFQEQLLSTKIENVANRADLRAILEKHRIFVSTLASFGGSEGLLKLKKFQRLIVDEASQILEPQLIGLLGRFQHTVLIGDHRQLPAVTVQRAENTRVADADLNAIGLYDLRDSYFERMYRLYQANDRQDRYTRLDRQGRMHADIMDFPNRYFYGGNLRTIAAQDADGATQAQWRQLQYNPSGLHLALEPCLTQSRVVFLPVPSDENGLLNQKTSKAEAVLAADIVLFFQKLYEANGKPWHPVKTLGIITPWRAQIAQIREALENAGLDPNDVTVDTVERYQGGAREIIIISTCANHEMQLGSLVNLSAEGIDRKLNVALTRAREHLIMLGNPDVLKKDAIYAAFIQQYAK